MGVWEEEYVPSLGYSDKDDWLDEAQDLAERGWWQPKTGEKLRLRSIPQDYLGKIIKYVEKRFGENCELLQILIEYIRLPF